MQDKEPWYSVKCIFRHDHLSQKAEEHCYEERVVVLKAVSLDHAIELGEAEARAYAGDEGTSHYIEFISAYHLYKPEIAPGAEVFSIMRRSNLNKDAFLDRYYDDGTECAQRSES